MSERYYIRIGETKLNAGRLQRFSKRIRAERGNVCECCGGSGTHVHHILEKHIFPMFAFEPDNVLALCANCHEKATLLQRSMPDWSHNFFSQLPQSTQKRIWAFRKRATTSLADQFPTPDTEQKYTVRE